MTNVREDIYLEVRIECEKGVVVRVQWFVPPLKLAGGQVQVPTIDLPHKVSVSKFTVSECSEVLL